MFHLACAWARERDVVYVDSDTPPDEAKRKLRIAREHGIRYLTPEFKVGTSMSNVVEMLEQRANSDDDLTGQVWIFDTLKKMTNVIQKSDERLLSLMCSSLAAE